MNVPNEHWKNSHAALEVLERSKVTLPFTASQTKLHLDNLGNLLN